MHQSISPLYCLKINSLDLHVSHIVVQFSRVSHHYNNNYYYITNNLYL